SLRGLPMGIEPQQGYSRSQIPFQHWIDSKIVHRLVSPIDRPVIRRPQENCCSDDSVANIAPLTLCSRERPLRTVRDSDRCLLPDSTDLLDWMLSLAGMCDTRRFRKLGRTRTDAMT